MKKTALALLAIFACVFMLSSCKLVSYMIGDVRTIANQNFLSLVNAILSEDKSAVKDLFANDSIQNDPDFDSSLDELIDYCKGEMVSYTNQGCAEGEDKFFIATKKYATSGYVLNTDSGIYHFHISECIYDNMNPGNIGINSLYIINDDDYPLKDMWYQGDYKNTDGINIGLYAEYSDEELLSREKFSTFLDAIEKKDKEQLSSLFAVSLKEARTDFDEKMENLLNIYSGTHKPFDRSTGGGFEDTYYNDDGYKVTRMRSYFFIETEENEFLSFQINECLSDEQNQDNVGIYYVKVYRENEEGEKETTPLFVFGKDFINTEWDE